LPIKKVVTMETIFIGVPAYNEEDIVDTIQTAIDNAEHPERVFIGVVLHYPKGNFPDLSLFSNVKVIKEDATIGLGLGITRGMAASFYNGEDYYLQIDGHSVFKSNWDSLLIEEHKKLSKIADKLIISMYVPYYYRDKETSKKLTMANDTSWYKDYLPWGQVAKDDPRAIDMDEDKFKFFAYGVEAINSPAAYAPDFNEKGYVEQYFIHGAFLFTTGKFLTEFKYDPELAYHEENAIAMLAWTRGYRIFSTPLHVLWTRGMMAPNGRDVVNSWRESYFEKDETGVCFRDKVIAGTLRNKDILTGKVLGEFGSPNLKLLKEYEAAANLDYKKFYENMYKEVEETRNKYPAADVLYNLERSRYGK